MSKNKIRLVDRKEDCCGCGTCALVCPKQAITMRAGELGSIYPIINHDQCIGCEKCNKICAYQSEQKIKDKVKLVYAAMAEKSNLLLKSASGGVFATVAENILDHGGIVYGCSMEHEDGKLIPRHIGIEEKSELHKLQGSKYVQSFLGDVFREVKKELKSQRIVLFSGTPCQVDALNKYLEKEDTSSLYTIDIICHGVPSAQLFEEYIKELEKKKHGKVTEFCFRDKTWGWGLNGKYTLINAKGEKSIENFSADISSYYSFFLESETYRQSCYSCKYAGSERVSDITIGDYWCVEKEHPEYLEENGGTFPEKKGISCILVNTLQGENLLENFSRKLKIEKTEFSKVAKWNAQLRRASVHTEKRNKIIDCYEKKGYKGIEKLFRNSLGIKYYVRLLRNRRRKCNKGRETNIS